MSQTLFDALAALAFDVGRTSPLIAQVEPHSREIGLAIGGSRRGRGEVGLPVAGFGNPRGRIVQPLRG